MASHEREAPKMVAALKTYWLQLASRERLAVSVAGAVVVAGLIWGLLLSPALSTLRQTQIDRARLTLDAQSMKSMAKQADALKALPRIPIDDARRALESATQKRLGQSARLSSIGERTIVTIDNISAPALAAFLIDARANARASIQEMHLTLNTHTPAGSASKWSGTLTIALPQP